MNCGKKKKKLFNVAVLPAPVRVPSQKPLVPSVASVTSVANDKDDNQGPDFYDMSSFFPCERDGVIQYINLGYGAQPPKIVILYCILFLF